MHPFETCAEPPARRQAKLRSWEELIHLYDPLVRGQLNRLLRSHGVSPEPEQIDERAQEVYCRLLTGGPRRLRQLRHWNEGQVVTYLSRVIQGVLADEIRARAAVKRGGGCRIVSRLCEIAERAVDPRGTPEDEALLREGRRVVLARCRSLLDPNLGQEDRRRSLRILRRALLDGWTGEEIRQAEGGRLAASTIHSLVHRVRRRLVSRYHPNP